MGSGRRARLVRARRMERLPQLGVLAHAVAVAADVDDVAVVKDSVDERRRHDVVAHDLAPVLCQNSALLK